MSQCHEVTEDEKRESGDTGSNELGVAVCSCSAAFDTLGGIVRISQLLTNNSRAGEEGDRGVRDAEARWG